MGSDGEAAERDAVWLALDQGARQTNAALGAVGQRSVDAFQTCRSLTQTTLKSSHMENAAPETAVPEATTQPVVSLTPGETKAILDNPYGLRLLMDHADLQFTMAMSMLEPGEVGPWPTPRWLALREQGRAIIARDPEIWDEDIRRAFGLNEPSSAS